LPFLSFSGRLDHVTFVVPSSNFLISALSTGDAKAIEKTKDVSAQKVWEGTQKVKPTIYFKLYKQDDNQNTTPETSFVFSIAFAFSIVVKYP
jgi:hypothetical protein